MTLTDAVGDMYVVVGQVFPNSLGLSRQLQRPVLKQKMSGCGGRNSMPRARIRLDTTTKALELA